MISVKAQCMLYLGACISTIALVVFFPYLPHKKELIHPSDSNIYSLYYDESWGGRSSAMWISPSTYHWRCQLVQSDFYPVCGIAISFPSAPDQTIDFSRFDHMVISMRYAGPAQKLRLYIRNHNPAYSTKSDVDSLKFNGLVMRTSDFKNMKTTISLNEFSVSDWWIDERDIPRHHAQPEMTNVVAIGVDFPSPHIYGQHDIEIKKIVLVGQLFSKSTLYLGLLLAWLVVIAAHAGHLLHSIYSKSDKDDRKLRDMHDGHDKAAHSDLENIDPLTGVLNRDGLTPTVEAIFNSERVYKREIVVLLFDIDGLERINKRRGRDMGDQVIKEIATLVKMSVRSHDVVARWSGEEFVLISTHTDLDAGRKLAEKMRSMVQNHTFKEDRSLNLTLSIGIASVNQGETFDESFKRANEALEMAKNQGRNRVEAAS